MVGVSGILSRAFSPLDSLPPRTQAVGLGWYMAAPLALNDAHAEFAKFSAEFAKGYG
jgi:hypothetical protein